MLNSITDVDGIKVGHYTDRDAATGCTVVLCERGASAGVDVRGSAPGTRETALLDPTCLVDRVHAVLLSGGSAFGLAAATGVMRFLEERGCGFECGVARVPIVPAAVLFDLTIGQADVRPDVEAGYQACLAANAGPVEEGCVGAGTGATVGKLLGPWLATKSGIGTASQRIGGRIVVGAIVAVNAFGDVVDPATNQIIAGTRKPTVGGFVNTLEEMKGMSGQMTAGFTNTTIGVVATNVYLDKAQANKVAQMAHDGLAMVIRPVHTMFDGDTIFALAMGKPGENSADVSLLGSVAAQVTAEAVLRAVRAATALHGIPACSG